MSYTKAVAETSWFNVQDPEPFVEFCEILDVSYAQDRTHPARFVLSAANAEGHWPSLIEPSEVFETWPTWLPVPPDCLEGIVRTTDAKGPSASIDATEAMRIWMTTPAEWPEETGVDFFDLIPAFMNPGSRLSYHSCLFDGDGHDLSIIGGVVHQDGRSTWIDFGKYLETIQLSERCTCRAICESCCKETEKE